MFDYAILRMMMAFGDPSGFFVDSFVITHKKIAVEKPKKIKADFIRFFLGDFSIWIELIDFFY